MTSWFILKWHFNVLVWCILFWKLELKLCCPKAALTLQLTVGNNTNKARLRLRLMISRPFCSKHHLFLRTIYLITWHLIHIRMEFFFFWVLLINILCFFDYGRRQPRESSQLMNIKGKEDGCRRHLRSQEHSGVQLQVSLNLSSGKHQRMEQTERAHVPNLINFQNGRMIRANKWANQSLLLGEHAALHQRTVDADRTSIPPSIHSSSTAFPLTASH